MDQIKAACTAIVDAAIDGHAVAGIIRAQRVDIADIHLALSLATAAVQAVRQVAETTTPTPPPAPRPAPEHAAPPALMTIKDVCATLGCSRTSVYKWEAQDATFPRRVHLGGRAVRWRRAEVEAWAASRPEAA